MPSEFDDQCRIRQCGGLLLTTTRRIEFQDEDYVGGGGVCASAGHCFDHRSDATYFSSQPDRLSIDHRFTTGFLSI
jgi:hypothetical protein